MGDDISTLTVREWVTMRMLARDPTAASTLRDQWDKLRYRGKVHDALYRLEDRGYATKEPATYHPQGVQWRLTERGLAVQAEVEAMLASLSRRH